MILVKYYIPTTVSKTIMKTHKNCFTSVPYSEILNFHSFIHQRLYSRYLLTGQHKQRINVHKHHASSGIRTNNSSFRTSEDSSCLRLLGHCDPEMPNSIIKVKRNSFWLRSFTIRLHKMLAVSTVNMKWSSYAITEWRERNTNTYYIFDE
jgi:hypothetical protein